MTNYIRKPTVVQAFQYDRQAKKDWPKWLSEYEIATPLGIQGVGAGAGVLLIPTKNGPTINVTAGEWLVLENGVLLVFRNDLFEAAFGAETVEQVETPVETAPTTTAPAAAPAADATTAEPAAPAKGDKKKPAGGSPAEDAPAAE